MHVVCHLYIPASILLGWCFCLWVVFEGVFVQTSVYMATDFPLDVFFFSLHPSLLVLLVRACWLIIFFPVFQIYGPSKHNNYGSQSFPGIYDAAKMARSLHSAESWSQVQHEVWRVSRVIKHASLVLSGQLT